jgi:hypothetical protein
MGGLMKNNKISRTELAAIAKGSARHVARVCLLELMMNGNLRITALGKGSCTIKFHSFPSFQYERVLADYFKTAKSSRDPIKYKTAKKFEKAVLDRLKRNGMIEPKGMYEDTWGLSEKGKTAAQEARKQLPALRKRLTPGMSGDLVRAFALDPEFENLFLEPFRHVCEIKMAGYAFGKDWFRTLWGSRLV